MGVNRRNFLKLMAAGGIAAMTGRVGQAAAAPPIPLLRATPAAERDSVHHLLNRIGYGPTPDLAAMVRKMGVTAYLESQLAPDQIDDSAVEARLALLDTLTMPTADILATQKRPREVIQELTAATVIRAAYSQRQLYEVMVQFWSEHFSIYHRKGFCNILKTADDREVIRPHALGNFRDLLHASAKSPAMLFYLDNAGSRKEHPNENYARELMELHTITVGNYTEDDVKEVARAFTGWTIQRREGAFQFVRRWHDDAEKSPLGLNLPAGGGQRDAEQILDFLAVHPATANHIASKLCRRFISDDPPQNVIDAVAAEFLRTGGDIKAMLRAIFAAPEFWAAPPKFKRPYEYTIGLLRAFEVTLAQNGAAIIGRALVNMGHLPFNWPAPDGYSDYAKDWIGTLLARWNLALSVVSGELGRVGGMGGAIGAARAAGAPRTPAGVLTHYAELLLGRSLSDAENSAFTAYAADHGKFDLVTPAGRQAVTEAIALIAASPAYMYR